MKRTTEQQKVLARLLVGVGYGGLIGLIIGLITGNLALYLICTFVWAVFFVSYGVVAVFLLLIGVLTEIFSFFLAGTMGWAGYFSLVLVRLLASAIAWVIVFSISGVVENINTSFEKLLYEHIDWLINLFNKSLFQNLHLFFHNRDHVKNTVLFQDRKRAWDVQLVVSFVNELAVVFPEEWDEWQHWISDMMEDRARMQSKGMNHRLVSLITFYRLTRFVWHIGIDKIFILATRRATR